MDKKRRLLGIDLLKGIAAFAVVIAHSEAEPGFSGSTGYWAEKVGQFSEAFAVPFFLAASFYLMIQKIYSDHTPYPFLPRLKRLFIPYIFWSLVYVFFRALKYLSTNNLLKLRDLFSDPIAIIFLGSASVQLYFIPLLLTGVFLVTVFMKFLLKKPINIKILCFLIIITTFNYEIMLNSDNSFNMVSGSAFESLQKLVFSEQTKNPLLRLILVEVSWMITCLPYIFVAMLLNHPFFKKGFSSFDSRATVIFFIMFFSFNTLKVFNIIIMPISVSELCIAYFSLLFAISLSSAIKQNHIITNLGLCSFGIYLMHHLVIQFIKPLVYGFSGDISMVRLLICATFSFLISWIATSYLTKIKQISRFMFFA